MESKSKLYGNIMSAVTVVTVVKQETVITLTSSDPAPISITLVR